MQGESATKNETVMEKESTTKDEATVNLQTENVAADMRQLQEESAMKDEMIKNLQKKLDMANSIILEEKFAMKDTTIEILKMETDAANKTILEYSCQIKEAQTSIENLQKENEKLQEEIISQGEKFRNVADQMKKKVFELEEEVEIEHEKFWTLQDTLVNSIGNAPAPARAAKKTPEPTSPDTTGASGEEAQPVAEEQVGAIQILVEMFQKLRSDYEQQRQRLINEKTQHELVKSSDDAKNEKIAHLRKIVQHYKKQRKNKTDGMEGTSKDGYQVSDNTEESKGSKPVKKEPPNIDLCKNILRKAKEVWNEPRRLGWSAGRIADDFRRVPKHMMHITEKLVSDVIYKGRLGYSNLAIVDATGRIIDNLNSRPSGSRCHVPHVIPNF